MALTSKVAEQPAKKARESKAPFFQAKLTVNEPGDQYEQEADAVADKVMRMPTPSVSDSKIHLKPIPLSQISRKCADCEKEEKIHRKESTNGGGQTAPSIVHDVIGSSGQSLDGGTRQFMESRMGHDFSHVQIHIDRKAAESAASVNALAYTSGNHVVFGSGQYQPGTEGGKRLLAHELVHTVQQGGGGVQRQFKDSVKSIQRRIGDGHDLTSPRFAGDPVLEACFDNEQVLRVGARGNAVRKIQQALIDAGFPLPRFGADGDLGSETQAALRSFQQTSSITIDGIVGPQTMGALNTRFSGGAAPVLPVPVLPPAPAVPCPLGITGPQEVDHYCAAYVPSDAASCGTFPAPNITLRATGAAAGAVLTWDIFRGTTKASIVGANNRATVSIKGDAKSATAGDVIVRVSNGTCSVTKAITVREPSHMVSAQNPTTTPTTISNQITYTVQDQFHNAMRAGICVDETITVCHNSIVGASFTFGDAPTDVNGQVSDNLSGNFPRGVPVSLCVKLNQTITAGGCGPLLRNTILYQQGGITLTPGSSCVAGDACP